MFKQKIILFIPITGDVGEPETVKTMQLYATWSCISVSTRLKSLAEEIEILKENGV